MSGMRKERSSGGSGGVGFVGLLQVAFIVLKLCHVIDWSWKWVLAPIWISTILIILLVVILVAFGKE